MQYRPKQNTHIENWQGAGGVVAQFAANVQINVPFSDSASNCLVFFEYFIRWFYLSGVPTLSAQKDDFKFCWAILKKSFYANACYANA